MIQTNFNPKRFFFLNNKTLRGISALYNNMLTFNNNMIIKIALFK